MLAYMNENDVDKDLRVEIEAKLENLGNDAEDDDGKSEIDEGKDENFVDEWDDFSDTQILARCQGKYICPLTLFRQVDLIFDILQFV